MNIIERKCKLVVTEYKKTSWKSSNDIDFLMSLNYKYLSCQIKITIN